MSKQGKDSNTTCIMMDVSIFPDKLSTLNYIFLRIYTITHADIPEILTFVCPFIFSLDILLYYRS